MEGLIEWPPIPSEFVKITSVIRMEGGRPSEKYAVVWHCIECHRAQSQFYPLFDEANNWSKLVEADPRCGRCREARPPVRIITLERRV